MKPIRCIAIDDEPMSLVVIEQFCLRKGGISLETYSEPHAGMEAIRRTRPDLVFLDIRMNGLDGLRIAEDLPEGCQLIFTTAYAQYALDGFELDAVDFLHKPFAYDRFEKAVEKAARLINGHSGKDTSCSTIMLKQEYSNVIIPVNDIIYLEAMENYTKVFRHSGKCILSRTSLKNAYAMLPEETFARIHKSYVIALPCVTEYTHMHVKLKGIADTIPIGRSYLENFLERMEKR